MPLTRLLLLENRPATLGTRNNEPLIDVPRLHHGNPNRIWAYAIITDLKQDICGLALFAFHTLF
jgi:hypothetical protein